MKNNVTSNSALLFFFLALFSFVYVPGLLVPLMDNDSAHHALIGFNMYSSGNYAYLLDLGIPYLDKPHLLFWLSALAYHLLGVTTLAYKIPSLIFTVLSVYSTYRLGKLLYGAAAGRLAAMILSTACAIVLANNDVRMEALLTGGIIFSIWQLCEYIHGRKSVNLILAAFGLALGFSTKGMIGVVIPAVTVFIHLVYQRNWKMVFHWKWLILLLLFGVFVSPVLYAYYLQYDLHPETVVRGRSHISGLKFILWNQNMERIKGEGHSQTKKDFFFFFHTFFWTFLPWSLLSVLSVSSRLKRAVQTRFAYKPGTELLTVGGVTFFMIFFSMSSFKLPHYLTCLFPLFSILLAGYLNEREHDQSRVKLFWNIQLYSVILIVLVAALLNIWVFPLHKMTAGLTLLLLVFIWLLVLFSRWPLYAKTIGFTLSGALLIFASLNLNFYPQLLSYQAGNELATVSERLKLDPRQVYYFQAGDYSFSYDFYTRFQHKEISMQDIKAMQTKNASVWLFTSAEGKKVLEENGVPVSTIFQNKDYRVSILKPKFLNPATRGETLTTVYLIKLF